MTYYLVEYEEQERGNLGVSTSFRRAPKRVNHDSQVVDMRKLN